MIELQIADVDIALNSSPSTEERNGEERKQAPDPFDNLRADDFIIEEPQPQEQPQDLYL